MLTFYYGLVFLSSAPKSRCQIFSFPIKKLKNKNYLKLAAWFECRWIKKRVTLKPRTFRMKEELNVSLFSFLSTLKLKKKKKMIVLSRLFVICVVVVLRCAPGYLCCLLKKILLYLLKKWIRIGLCLSIKISFIKNGELSKNSCEKKIMKSNDCLSLWEIKYVRFGDSYFYWKESVLPKVRFPWTECNLFCIFTAAKKKGFSI